jgi:hypothetical protein
MSLFQRPIQPPAILSDQAVERYLEAVRAELAVDPLFRQRLRGAVVNRFVAAREARAATPGRSRRMGALGRSVLYASFALSVSVSAAMAASQGAVPGDGLYPLKLQIERLRLEALPAHLHDELAAHSLGERIHELGVLAERGDWARVATQAAAVEDEYRHFADVAGRDGSSDRHLVVLSALLDRLPDRAQHAIENVLDSFEAASDGAADPGAHGRGRDTGSVNQGGGANSANEGRGADAPEPTDATGADPTAKPSRPARPDPTPRASKSPRPSADPTAPASPAAEATDD